MLWILCYTIGLVLTMTYMIMLNAWAGVIPIIVQVRVDVEQFGGESWTMEEVLMCQGWLLCNCLFIPDTWILCQYNSIEP